MALNMAMLIGAYELQLNRSCAFRLPKRVADELYAASGQKEVCFAAAAHLRCYTAEGARAYVAGLVQSGGAQSFTWARLTAAGVAVKVASGGILRIPNTLCKIYGFKPQMNITLLGCGDYIELHPGVGTPSPNS